MWNFPKDGETGELLFDEIRTVATANSEK